MRRFAGVPLALGALTALLLLLSCPPFSLGFLAWVALVPVLIAIAAAGRDASAGAVVAGVLWGAGLFYPVLFVEGGTWVERVGGALLLVALVALFFFLFGLATAHLRSSWRGSALLLPFVWIALEYAFRLLFQGFAPYLGVTQWQNGWMLAFASYAGIHGVSAFVVGVNVAVSQLVISLLGLGTDGSKLRSWGVYAARRPPVQWLPILLGGVTLLMVIGQESGFYGALRSEERAAAARAGVQRVYLVQPGFTAEEYDRAESLSEHAAFLVRAKELTRAALESGASEKEGLDRALGGGAGAALPGSAGGPQPLVVWPETVLHFPAFENAALGEQIRAAAREWNAWLLLGLPRQERAVGGGETLWNSAFLLSPAGSLVGFYDKVHVIPIAEDQFAPGGRVEALGVGDYLLGVGICSDAVVPSHARRAVLEGAQALFYLSSLGRIGDLAWMEVAFLAFRAAEHRVPVLQVSTTGPTVIFGSNGRLVERLPEGEPGVLAAPLELRAGTGAFYTRFGDWVLLMAGAIMFASGVVRSRRRLRVW